MQKVLQNLLELQTLDAQLAAVRARLAALPKKLSEADARVAAAKAEVERAKAAQLTALKDRKKYELDVEQWKDKVRKYRDQTSLIKTNDAFRALQHEVQLAEAEIAKAEDRLLEQMVSAEEFDRRIKASEKTLKEVEDAMRRERAQIETEKSAEEKAVAEMDAERARLVVEIPEDLLGHYERIAKKHNGVALAEVRDEKCTACGMRVRPHVFQALRRVSSDQMFHCETCTRILYYVEPAEPGRSDVSREDGASASASAAAQPAPLPRDS